jgi:subtilase family serine protease
MLAAKAADENSVGLTIGNLFRQKCGISDTVGYLSYGGLSQELAHTGATAHRCRQSTISKHATWGRGTMGKHHILGTTALVALVVSMSQASAGGLAIREQSAWGEGSSYAGVAAGGSVSAMFWNPRL